MNPENPIPKNNSNGFTLLEILVALSIFSLIIAALFASLGSSATHAKRIRERMADHQELRFAMQRIASDLAGAYWKKDKKYLFFHGKKGNGFEGREDNIEFTAIRPRWRPSGIRNELVSISYRLRPLPKGKGLKREEKSLWGYREKDFSKPVVLLEDIHELVFEYVDRENRKYDSWSTKGLDNKTSLPAAVRITVKMKGEDGTFQFFSSLTPIPSGLYEPGIPTKEAAKIGSGHFLSFGRFRSDRLISIQGGQINRNSHSGSKRENSQSSQKEKA